MSDDELGLGEIFGVTMVIILAKSATPWTVNDGRNLYIHKNDQALPALTSFSLSASACSSSSLFLSLAC